MNYIRLMVVDDHMIVRWGLRRYIALLPDIEIVAEAASGCEALSHAPAVAPDVILLDMMMGDLDGIATARQLQIMLPQTPIVFFTTFCTSATVLEAMRVGAKGFLLKDAGIDEFSAAIHSAVAGNIYLQPYAAQQLVAGTLATPEPVRQLTSREHEICMQIARGLNNKEIAANLQISAKTVSVHLSNIMSKLDLASRTQVARYVLERGIAAAPIS